MNKSKAMVAGLVAATLGLGFGSAQAQGWRDGGESHQQRYQHQGSTHWRGDRQGQVQAQPQWQGRQQWQGRSQWQGQGRYAPQYQSRACGGYAGAYRGGYAGYAYPHHYRAYDWRARHLSAPPYGYRWVEDDSGDVLLMALATGLIANAIVNSAAAPAQPYYYPAPAQPYYQAPDYPY